MPGTFEQAVFLFAFYSFCGYLVEVIYRSVNARRFVNPGFLHGPFVPLYGFGAGFVMLLAMVLPDKPLLLRVIAFGVTLTLLEYVVGWILERIFHLQLWTYADTRFHFQGKVSLTFSLAWTVLAFVFLHMVHPEALEVVNQADGFILRLLAMAFSAYLVLDTLLSVAELKAFGDFLERVRTGAFLMRDFDLEPVLRRIKRLRVAFPHLNSQVFGLLKKNLPGSFQTHLQTGYRRLLSSFQERVALEAEYLELVGDILDHPEFLRLRDFFHHNSSIYEHARAVSYLSYSIAKKFGIDYRSAARGGLLHDFFLYDWRNHDVPDLPKEKFHGFAHPKIALKNAEENFELNDIERDCIVKHMWPLTLAPPKYRESFVVCMADKFVASREYITGKNARETGKTSPENEELAETTVAGERNGESRPGFPGDPGPPVPCVPHSEEGDGPGPPEPVPANHPE